MRLLRGIATLTSVILASSTLLGGAQHVRMLIPGFSVQELPIDLPNINNLRFRPDGALSALGYDGRIWLLKDTNGDGLEDQVQLFWDGTGISVPLGMSWTAEGLYVSSHGKISLLRDTDGDGKADREDIVVSGWPATDVGSGGVDATGVVPDNEGNLYFGLLVADYSNAYRLRDNVSTYDLRSPRGTIQRWNRASGKLETLANGVRVPYQLGFNRHGDLFFTDQEGETWMPNGNPLDELNHVIRGRNYGFPPRHPRWLPEITSELPIATFGPQHQSSCGFVFNEPQVRSAAAPSRGLFGPSWWEGNAFVAGESRGKIWRVPMVKTSLGYVARPQLIARLDMLTMDLAISGQGELYVACHSGEPDWGTGPNGRGKLFKITFHDSAAPQLVRCVPTTAGFVLQFDHHLDSSTASRMEEISIDYGDFVSAGDRFENLKPPYEVVRKQGLAGRGKLPVLSARVDHASLILETPSLPLRTRYAISIPGLRGASSMSSVDFETDCDFGGAFIFDQPEKLTNFLSLPAIIQSAGFVSYPSRTTWRAFDLQDDIKKGTVSFRLQPPAEAEKIVIRSARPFSLRQSHGIKEPYIFRRDSHPNRSKQHLLEISRKELGDGLSLTLISGSPSADFDYGWLGDDDTQPRVLPLRSFLLPWAPNSVAPPLPASARENTSVRGDYENGRGLFFGPKLNCASCHRIRGEGKSVGPDLSNLVSRDPEGVLRDIRDPGAAINPDYVAYTAKLRDDTEVTGFIRKGTSGSVQMFLPDERTVELLLTNVVHLAPSPTSIMPSGLLDSLTEGEVRDLLTFLLNEAPKRSEADIEHLLKSVEPVTTNVDSRKLKLVLVANAQDHGPGQHDYPTWQKNWSATLSRLKKVSVETAWEWPSAEQFESANLLVFYYWNHGWSPEKLEAIDHYQNRGGGIVLIHAATIAEKNTEEIAERFGLAALPGKTGFRHTPFELSFAHPPGQTISSGFQTLALLDEPYWPMLGKTESINILATTIEDEKAQPMIWTFEHGKGRVFASIPGHYTWTLEDPAFRILLLRGMAWAARVDENRFARELTTNR
jgi:putative heme-binding domain-containing protein